MKSPYLKRAVWPAIALSAFILAGCGEKTSAAPERPESPVRSSPSRQLAPLFTVKTLGNRTFSLQSKRGAPVVVNLWASWCTPCGIEAPALEKAYREHKGKGVEFIGVAVEDTKKDVLRFAAKHKLTFPIALDEKGDVSLAYRASIIPQTFVIGPDGYVSYVRRGAVSEEELAREIAKVLPPVKTSKLP